MDQASMESLYRTYGSMVLRRARTLLGDDTAAQDMVQEVFMKAIRAFPGFRGESSLTTWLYQVTTNRCLNAIRDGARRRRALERRMPPSEPVTESAEDRVGVDELLKKLPRELAEVAIYYYVDQMNQDEIAALLGISERTVRNRLRDFKNAARERLDPGSSEEAAG
jgi:RNA polymerase sigma-70 factor (ECF subfamily)